jgi:hypothetical protein
MIALLSELVEGASFQEYNMDRGWPPTQTLVI